MLNLSTEVAVTEPKELQTSKGGCLTPGLLVLIILGVMLWKLAHGDTGGITFYWP